MSNLTTVQPPPLDLSLADKDGKPVLAVKALADDTLTLNIQNRLFSDLEIHRVGDSQHHFALELRPGVLKESTLDKITVKEGGWDVEVLKSGAPGGAEGPLIKLRSTLPRPRTIAKRSTFTLTLEHLTPSDDEDARSSDVELHYANINVGGDDTRQLEGSLMRVLRLEDSGAGKPPPPLSVFLMRPSVLTTDPRAQNAIQVAIRNDAEEVLKLKEGARKTQVRLRVWLWKLAGAATPFGYLMRPSDVSRFGDVWMASTVLTQRSGGPPVGIGEKVYGGWREEGNVAVSQLSSNREELGPDECLWVSLRIPGASDWIGHTATLEVLVEVPGQAKVRELLLLSRQPLHPVGSDEENGAIGYPYAPVFGGNGAGRRLSIQSGTTTLFGVDASGESLKIGPGETQRAVKEVLVLSGDGLELASQKTLRLHTSSTLAASSGATLKVESGASLRVEGDITVPSGGRLELENGSRTSLYGKLSVGETGSIQLGRSSDLTLYQAKQVLQQSSLELRSSSSLSVDGGSVSLTSSKLSISGDSEATLTGSKAVVNFRDGAQLSILSGSHLDIGAGDFIRNLVWGTVASNGTTRTGAGFDSRRNGTGNYTVIINGPWSTGLTPVMVVTVRDSGNGCDNYATLNGVKDVAGGKKEFNIWVQDRGKGWEDAGFNFVMFG